MYDLELFHPGEEETGTETLRGVLRYAAGHGGWQLGDTDLTEYLARYDGHEMLILVSSMGKVREVPVKCVCDLCGGPLDDLGGCPRCQLNFSQMVKKLRAKQQRHLLFRKVEQVIEETWQDGDGAVDRPHQES